MKRAIIHAIAGWLPGVFAGALPFLAFLLVAALTGDAGQGAADSDGHHFTGGVVTHLLVMAMVTSGVGLATAIVQFWFKGLKGYDRDGFGPLLTFLLLMGSMVVATGMYVLFEAGVHLSGMLSGATYSLLAALALSLYMEFSIARLHILAEIRAKSPPQHPGSG